MFETAWTIAPTLFLGSTFGIAKNDNTDTEDDWAKEESGGWGEMSTNMTIRKKKLIGCKIIYVHFFMTEKPPE